MLATLLGAYTIVGFESSANLAEETRDPQRVVPRAMVRAVLMSGVIGGVFLIALAVAATDLQGASRDAAPVAFILKGALGNSIERVFLLFICVSIFACGLIIMVTNTRLIWAMARDRRLPGHQLLGQVPRPTGGPTWSTALAAATSAAIVLVLQHNATALLTLFTASTIMPAILYAGTVLLYVAVARKLQPEPGRFHLGRWERAVVLGALAWLAYELVILLGPAQFRSAQLYAVGAVALGVVVYGLMWLLEPAAMRWQPGVAEEPAAPAPAADPAAAGPPPDLLGSQSQPWLPPPAAAQWPPTWAAQPAPSSSPPSPPQAPQWPPEWATPTAPQQWQQPRMAQQARTAAPQWPPSAPPSPDFGGHARMVTRITFKRDAVLAGQPLPPLPGATVDASGSTVIVDTDYPTGAVLSLARWAAEAGYRELPELTIAPAGFGAGEPRPAPADEHEFAARPRRMRW
jgi:hypothetical protein